MRFFGKKVVVLIWIAGLVAISAFSNLSAFHLIMKDPHIRAFTQAVPAAKTIVCQVMKETHGRLGYDDLGGVVAREVPVKTCEDVL